MELSYTPIQADSVEKPQHSFILFNKIPLSFSLGTFLFAVGTVIGGTGQSVTLSLFEATFGGTAGVYFVLFFCGLFFNIIFWPGALWMIYKGEVSDEMRQWKWHPNLFLIGFCDALNGFMVVYSSILSRVPGPLQAVLQQAYIPYTLLFSYLILKKKYSRNQVIGAFIVLIGVFYSMIPMFQDIHNGTQTVAVEHGAGWPICFLLAFIPGALMNIFQEQLQSNFKNSAKGNKRYGVLYLQAWESLYQFLSFVMLFWLDIIPGFGSSSNINGFWNTFTNSWKCFFTPSSSVSDKCNYCAGLGIIFVMSYTLSYIFSTLMTLYASANLVSVVSSLPPICSTIFWFAFPSVTKWADATPSSSYEAAYNFGSIPYILMGTMLYRMYEVGKADKEPDESELQQGAIELCWNPNSNGSGF